MIEIKRKGNLIMPLTRWAVSELMNEDIIDSYDVLEYSTIGRDIDELDAAIGYWYEMLESGDFMLSHCKFEGKIEVIND